MVKVPVDHAIVSLSVAEKVPENVHPCAATFVFESPTVPERVEVATDPPVMVAEEAVNASDYRDWETA